MGGGHKWDAAVWLLLLSQDKIEIVMCLKEEIKQNKKLNFNNSIFSFNKNSNYKHF